ncbi:MAG TPA: FAD-dependent oxidoreductase, partial [Dongiaceae bacterium]|nr:FAD-dependent oxidoreductase [Dongiaceae bacterium]
MTHGRVAEVIVVGGGIAGVSCAFHLAGLGVKTTLVERRHPAAGPTGRSSAICHAFYLMPELSRLGARGTEILRDLPALTGGGPDAALLPVWGWGPTLRGEHLNPVTAAE